MSQKKSVEITPDKQKNKRSAMVSHRMQQEVSKVRSKVQNYSDDGHESPAEYAEDSIRNTFDEVIYDTGHGIRQAIKGAVRKDGSSPADEHKPTGETVDSEVMPSPQQPYSAQRQAIMRNEQKTSVTHRQEQQREMIISESVANTQMDNEIIDSVSQRQAVANRAKSRAEKEVRNKRVQRSYLAEKKAVQTEYRTASRQQRVDRAKRTAKTAARIAKKSMTVSFTRLSR